ncbi:MAG TPA: hypothetical protein VG935_03245 [Patescibacteria group bacterium]|nr:hypothetical protein [Patescibacteria group bacterium]
MLTAEQLEGLPYEKLDRGVESVTACVEEYDAGKLPLKAALAYIDRTLRILDIKVKTKEKEDFVGLKELLGIDFLGTDEQGRRSEAELQATNPLATGFASSCLSVALIHPDYGIAAAHSNPFSPNAMQAFIRRGLKEGITLGGLVISDDLDRQNELLRDADLATHTTRTVQTAVTQFRGLTQQKSGLPSGTDVYLIGYDFITPERMVQALRTTQEALQNAAMISGPGRTIIKPSIMIKSSLGEAGGFVYGGKDHIQFSKPTQYSMIPNNLMPISPNNL